MMWKVLFLAACVAGVLAEYKITDEHRKQMKSMLTEQCKKNGAEDKVDEVEAAGRNFVDCLKELIDFNTIRTEVEEAKPKGELDVVFKKYCDKSTQFKGCFHALLSGVEPCMDSRAREHMTEVNNGIDQLMDFICYKDGDRIALFIAEGGPECFASKASAIKDCGENISKSVASVEQAKALTTAEQCAKFDQLTKCTVTALEECSEPTPGNMMDSLFRYIRKESPCKDIAVANA